MKITTRIQEWLACRISWVPFPEIRPRYLRPSLWRRLSGRQQAWTLTVVGWILLLLLAVFGNLIE